MLAATRGPEPECKNAFRRRQLKDDQGIPSLASQAPAVHLCKRVWTLKQASHGAEDEYLRLPNRKD